MKEPEHLVSEHRAVKRRTGKTVRWLRCSCGWEIRGPAAELSPGDAVAEWQQHRPRRASHTRRQSK